MENLTVIMIIFFTSSCLQGITGFGFSLLSVPLLSLFLSPRIFVPILIIYSLIINLVVIFSAYREIRLKDILILLPTGFLGVPIGAYLLRIMSAESIQLIIGITLVLYILYQSFIRINFSSHSILINSVAGFVSGFLGGSISMSGPPIIMLFSAQERKKHNFRSNLAIYFFILNIITIITYLSNKMINQTIINKSILYSPAMLGGVILGNYLAHKVSEEKFKRYTILLILIMGVLAILSGLHIL